MSAFIRQLYRGGDGFPDSEAETEHLPDENTYSVTKVMQRVFQQRALALLDDSCTYTRTHAHVHMPSIRHSTYSRQQ